jgi:hypothetical protein
MQRPGLLASSKLSRLEKAERHNIDYFTLIKTDGVWMFLTLAYVGTPVESE